MPETTCHLPRRPPWLWGKGKCRDPRNGMATLLVLHSEPDSRVTHGLKIFVVWPIWTSPRINGFCDRVVSRPTRGQPCVCARMCLYTHTHVHTHTHASVEVNKLQTSVLQGPAR